MGVMSEVCHSVGNWPVVKGKMNMFNKEGMSRFWGVGAFEDGGGLAYLRKSDV